jgi:hypothetical protein
LRLLFGAALAGLVFALSFQAIWRDILAASCSVVAVIGGNAMLVRQILERRRAGGLVQGLRDDILKGVVWRFERQFPAGGGTTEMERHTIDVLPESQLAVKVNDAVLDRPALVRVTAVAAGTGGMDAPLAGYEHLPSAKHFDFRQRHLTSEEEKELTSLLKRDFRNLLISAAALLWAGTALANGLHAFVTKQSPNLTASSMLIALALVIVFAGRRFAVLRRVRADLLSGIVIVLRRKDQGTEEVTFERLPTSNVAWSEFGAPARWRM